MIQRKRVRVREGNLYRSGSESTAPKIGRSAGRRPRREVRLGIGGGGFAEDDTEHGDDLVREPVSLRVLTLEVR